MSFYDGVVPAYLQILGSLGWHPHQGRSALQGKEHRAGNTADRAALSGHAAVQQADPIRVCDFAEKGCARLTQSEVPSTPDTEKTFEELRQRLAKTTDYVKSFKPAQFEGADTRDVTFPIGPEKTATLKGQQFLSGFSLPNFYFHAATAHGILRHNGVEIGKRDFMGI